MADLGMHRSHRPMRARIRILICALAALSMLVAAGPAATANPAKPPQASEQADRTVTVMSRNLYLGASLTPLFTAQDFPALIGAVLTTWAQVQATEYPTRAKALADEVAETQPDLIGLQEVTRWEFFTQQGVPVSRLDFLEILLDELAQRGQSYAPVASVTNFVGTQPYVAVDPFQFLRLTDRGVILARTDLRAGDLRVSNDQAGNFATNLNLELPLPGEDSVDLEVLRGWTSVDVKVRGQSFRFVNTHLEAFDASGEPLRTAQTMELLAGPLKTDLPTILVGDINSPAPAGAAYVLLTQAGLADPWPVLRPSEPGFTCCQDDDLRNATSKLETRIDVTLASSRFRATSIDLVGAHPSDRIEDLWPSDHAGVVTSFILDPPSAVRRR
jgi:endonuclease/exonuclease/phosphatase family metal-dependent hydrolase